MNKTTPFNPPFPKKNTGLISWEQLYGSSTSLAIANAAITHRGITLVVTPDMFSASRIEHELKFFTEKKLPIHVFPDLETLPYDQFSPHQDIISQRLKTLNQLTTLEQGIFIVAISTLMYRLPPKEYLTQHSLFLKTGQKIDLSEFRKTLVSNGYTKVHQVSEHGEFVIRGAILDLFPMGSSAPFRIELFDNEIETIRTFNPDSQRSVEKITEIELLPAHEFSLDENSIQYFRQSWREHFEGNPIDCPLYEDISDGHYTPGIEYYLPLFFDHTTSLIGYLPSNTTVIQFDTIYDHSKQYWHEIQTRHEQLQHDRLKPILQPKEIFLRDDELLHQLKAFRRIHIHQSSTTTKNTAFTTLPPPHLTIDHKTKQPLKKLEQFIQQQHETRILFTTDSTGRRESMLHLLQGINIQPALFETWSEFLNSNENIGITIATIEEGLYAQNPDIAIIAESQIFGEKIQQRRQRTKNQQDVDAIIRDLTELHIGDPVVHLDHGVGRFLGLQTITVGKQIDEYLTLEYAAGDKLFVPVASLELISRYTGTDPEHAPLHKLGTNQWDKIKRKAQERVEDVAAELLDVYARRAARKGHAFAPPDQNYYSFSESFPFEETLDQEKAIEEVIQDMVTPKPMDRLICGDVGFGKTEVAMRASFLCVMDKKQVAMLVPTTLLAQQHYESFKNRFADWPIKIEMLSRFKTSKEQKEIIEQLKDGKVDLIIGTHKLLQEDIAFQNLGLLIIDEEHRFGVKQKERLKSLRAHVDILALTATPIPRTLNMAFSGIRDLSIISTPPQKRLSIKTFIQKPNHQTIREAILREIMRGGQIYYLHNEVATIERRAQTLRELIPEARIAVAHGQLHARTLEHVMMDFYHRRFNILVCSTIIESGIDIPSANTIIIDRADKFGLAQLHQLRGRVGRSHHQAYAYLLTPDKSVITKDAVKRLDAFASLEDLGAGFALATHDLEIRGAGELLGDEQSGHMQAIGFNLYMEMLERAVKALKSGKRPELDQPLKTGIEIEFHAPAIIPEDYLPDVNQRLILYKRIANAADAQHLEDLRVEMIDRFGLLPEPTHTLFEIAELKLFLSPIGIQKIEMSDRKGTIEFQEKPNIDPVKLIQLIQKHEAHYKLMSATRLQFKHEAQKVTEKISVIEQLIKALLIA